MDKASDTHNQYVNDFLLWLRVERGRAESTLQSYKRDLGKFNLWLNDQNLNVNVVGEDAIIQFLRNLQKDGFAQSTVARTMVSVRSFFRFLNIEGIRHDNPTKNIELPRVSRGLPKPISEREVNELLASVEGDNPAERRDRAILELLYGTGARISEVVNLSLGDIDMHEGLLKVLGKGDKERIVPLGSYAMQALIKWLEPAGRGQFEPDRWKSRDDSEAVFLNRGGGRLSRQGGWGIVKKYGSKVGLGSQLSPHTLRHCCATHMLEHGADIRTVQELLGHASITTTQIYTKVSREQLLDAYRAAHPRALT
ncbi:MAG: site-specific tyrosine recombinase XerD [Actinomycetota bacterium]|nr:site-specific tyrosine recombinase XerD [Actinomycetota bacterium]